ncbi:MAG TPA: hypothetical protein VFE30_14680 [Anaeromyxobacteraceae bacterium]|jgi:hypothetical protein|nr:hypothetical protein [Anaeromyxobacteraceae bacterium]
MPAPITFRRTARASGAALIFVLALVLALTVLGVALVKIAGTDRVDAAMAGVKDRGLACAEAGIQYGRRFYGSNYDTSHGWNDYLNATLAGYRYDYTLPASSSAGMGFDAHPDLSGCTGLLMLGCPVPKQTLGYSDGQHLDPGADIDGDGSADFWVSVRDDDDERPLGLANNPTQDNNETIIIRSECINPKFQVTQGGKQVNVAIEAVLTHVQGSSGYGAATRASNASDLVGNL